MKQSWRYPDVALRTGTGLPATAQPVAGDASVEAIAAAIRDGQDVVANTQTRPDQMGLVCGTGLIFAHAYTVVDADPMTRTVTLRNPWGSDGQATVLTALASGARSIFTLGSDSDGMVSVSWDVFEQAFATYAVA
jgi:hypothetical protein